MRVCDIHHHYRRSSPAVGGIVYGPFVAIAYTVLQETSVTAGSATRSPLGSRPHCRCTLGLDSLVH
jgi:hypothetical protein